MRRDRKEDESPRFRYFEHPPIPGVRSKELDAAVGEWYFWGRKKLSDAILAQGVAENRRG